MGMEADKQRRRLQVAAVKSGRIELSAVELNSLLEGNMHESRVKEKGKNRKGREVAEMGREEMRLLSRPDCVGVSYTHALMYNVILDRSIYIYHQTKHFAQSYSMEDMTKQFIIVYCFHYLSIWVKMIWVKSRDNDFYYASILELL